MGAAIIIEIPLKKKAFKVGYTRFASIKLSPKMANKGIRNQAASPNPLKMSWCEKKAPSFPALFSTLY